MFQIYRYHFVIKYLDQSQSFTAFVKTIQASIINVLCLFFLGTQMAFIGEEKVLKYQTQN